MVRFGVAVLLLNLVIASPGGEAAGEEGEPREMIHAYRVWKLTEVLDLSEETMPLFFSRLRDLEEKEVELVRQEQKGIRRIAELLGEDDTREEELKRALEKHEASRAKRMEEIRSLRREALAMLDTRQKCRYVVFEHRFRAELRDMIEKAREWRKGQREGPGPGNDLGWPDPGGRGVGRGTPGGSGRGRR